MARLEGAATNCPIAPIRCQVMGIVNVTPDSFSDGGFYLAQESAVEQGVLLARAGADIIDVGGESTRPGAARVSARVELERVVPVVRELSRLGLCVSVDTMRSQVAAAAVTAGAQIVNDVSGGLADSHMYRVIADLDVRYVLTHWRAQSLTMSAYARYHDVVEEVLIELGARVDAATRVGLCSSRIVVDPGLGFAKTADHNWELLRSLPRLHALGLPVLVGASRKQFLGDLLGHNGRSRSVLERDDATTAVTALAAQAGAWAVRVHSAGPSRDAVEVAHRWSAAGLAPASA